MSVEKIKPFDIDAALRKIVQEHFSHIATPDTFVEKFMSGYSEQNFINYMTDYLYDYVYDIAGELE